MKIFHQKRYLLVDEDGKVYDAFTFLVTAKQLKSDYEKRYFKDLKIMVAVGGTKKEVDIMVKNGNL